MDFKLIIKRNLLSIIIVLFLLYLFLLAYNINSIGLLVGDEKVYRSSVFSLLDGKIDNNNHPLLAKTIWYYFVYIFSGITGIYKPIFYRLGTILFSIGSLLVFYKIARVFFSKTISFLCVILLAIDPMFFTFSRLLQLDIPALFFLLSSIYYYLKYLDGKKLKLFYVSGIFLGLSLAAKLSAVLLIPLFPLLFMIFNQGKNLKLREIAKINFLFLTFLSLAFTIGNGIFFFKKTSIGFAEFIYRLFNSQIGGLINLSGYLHSPAWTWFTIPQILTLYRVPQGESVMSIIAFANPLITIFTLISLVASMIFILRKGILKQKKQSFLVMVFSLLYLPWFFNLHATFYYYIIPLIPMAIIMFLLLIRKTKIKLQLLASTILVSIIIFAIYYPLLVGIKVPRSYDVRLYSFSLYRFNNTDTIFCQQCYPRK